MTPQDIYKWISQARSTGLSDAQIHDQLKSSGWEDSQITQLLGSNPVPVSAQTPSMAMEHPIEPKPKRSRVGLIIGIIIAIIILGAAGVTYAAWKGYITVPVLSPYLDSLQGDAIEKAFHNMTNLTGEEVTFTASLAGEPRAAGAKALSGDSVGNSFDSLPISGDATATFTLTVFAKQAQQATSLSSMKNSEAQMSASFSYRASGTTLSGKAEMLMKSGILYAKVTEFPDLGLMDLSSFVDTWYSIDVAKTLESNPLTNVAIQNSNSSTASAWQAELSPLYHAAHDSSFLTFTDKGKDIVSGMSTKKYIVTIDPDKMQKFIDAYHADAKKRSVSVKELEDVLTDLQKPDTQTSLRDALNTNTFSIWITNDTQVAKISFENVVVPPDSATTLKDRQFRLTLSATFDKFNQQPTVVAPTGATDLMELLGGARKDAFDSQRKSDLAQLQTAMALYYDDNQNYPVSLNDVSPKYIIRLPIDPKTSASYTYASSDGQLSYRLCAKLESGEDYCLARSNGGYCANENCDTTTTNTNSNTNQSNLNLDQFLNTNTNSAI